ncbi:hypothetical protein EHE19_015505 [Ruminiclostridium herbifermentans]|uniref:Uncharacterized protein n=1 Tax=Ruminiclostridium herbifermentans TaxID=2488810 RepID=A0A7H1VLK9_9FIRM|nr:hypothetical protein [Ruminiclostridium herbifermentans]QNU66271.1 hypothetical protein EHE19_015505 [Ruminiclostridium herbifermentans]
MIIKSSIITDLNIQTVKDLYKLKPFMEDATLKVNKSQIARELDVDRRTVACEGGQGSHSPNQKRRGALIL